MSNIASMIAAKRATQSPAPVKQERDTLAWESVNPADLPANAQEAFFAIAKARSAFEAIMTNLIEPEDHLKLAFAYKRGLAIALAPKSGPTNGLANLIARANKG